VKVIEILSLQVCAQVSIHLNNVLITHTMLLGEKKLIEQLWIYFNFCVPVLEKDLAIFGVSCITLCTKSM